MTDLPQDELRQRFFFTSNTSKLEIITDRSGMTVRERRRKELYVPWSDVEQVKYSPPEQGVELVVSGRDEDFVIPFLVDGEDGGFDELLHTLLSSTDITPQKEPPVTFGKLNKTRISIWLMAGAIGSAASLIANHLYGGHGTIGALIAAMWLFTVWYGGLCREVTLTVRESGFELRRLLSRQRFTYDELSNIGLRHHPAGGGKYRLGLVLAPRAGAAETITGIGGDTLEAFLTLRRALKKG